MKPEDGEVTMLLAELSRGKDEAASRLIPLVYSELRKNWRPVICAGSGG